MITKEDYSVWPGVSSIIGVFEEEMSGSRTKKLGDSRYLAEDYFVQLKCWFIFVGQQEDDVRNA